MCKLRQRWLIVSSDRSLSPATRRSLVIWKDGVHDSVPTYLPGQEGAWLFSGSKVETTCFHLALGIIPTQYKLEEKRKASSSMKLPAALLESSQLPFLCAKENGCLSELKCSNDEEWKNPSLQVDQQAGTKNLSVCHTEDGWYLFCLLLMPPPSLLFPLSPFPSVCLPISKVWCG